MEFECECGAVVSVTQDGGDSELNVHTGCDSCENKYAVTITSFAGKQETGQEVS